MIDSGSPRPAAQALARREAGIHFTVVAFSRTHFMTAIFYLFLGFFLFALAFGFNKLLGKLQD
jgi:hypothetical protein